MNLNSQFITIFLLFVILILALSIVLLLFLIFKFITQNKVNLPPSHASQKNHRREVEHKHDPNVQDESYCQDHPKRQAISTCSICNKSICKECLREESNLHFCSEHLKTFLKNDWSVLAQSRSTADFSLEGLSMYQFKLNIWEEKNIPSFFTTHYQIDVNQDHIETHVELHVRSNEFEELKLKFMEYKKASQ